MAGEAAAGRGDRVMDLAHADRPLAAGERALRMPDGDGAPNMGRDDLGRGTDIQRQAHGRQGMPRAAAWIALSGALGGRPGSRGGEVVAAGSVKAGSQAGPQMSRQSRGASLGLGPFQLPPQVRVHLGGRRSHVGSVKEI